GRGTASWRVRAGVPLGRVSDTQLAVIVAELPSRLDEGPEDLGALEDRGRARRRVEERLHRGSKWSHVHRRTVRASPCQPARPGAIEEDPMYPSRGVSAPPGQLRADHAAGSVVIRRKAPGSR